MSFGLHDDWVLFKDLNRVSIARVSKYGNLMQVP